MDFENNKRTKRRKNRNSIIIFTMFTICMFTIMLCVFLLYSYQQQRQAAAQAMIDLGAMEDSYNELEDKITSMENEHKEEIMQQELVMAEIRAEQEQREDTFTQEQVDAQVNAAVKDSQKDILQGVRDLIEEGEGTLSILQFLFPDEVIVPGDGTYEFFPINDSLNMNEFNLENFTYPEYNEEKEKWEGTASYVKESGSYAKKGIDVSTFQGTIDWKKVKADGMEYAIIRLGYRGYESGKIVLDEKYKENIEGSLAAGIDTGVYFFTEAIDEEEAIEEADFVIENLKGYDIEMPVVIDVEESASPEKTRTKNVTKEQRTKNVIAFCDRIKDAGYEVMIYGNLKSFFLMMDFEELENYDKWFAYYRYPFHFPYKIKMWQYTSSESVDGISGKVDVNLMFY